jgi:AraC-like DNA-binding protein
MPPPTTFDILAAIMLLGVMQGALLGAFFLLRKPGRITLQILGWLLVCLALTNTEILLCYTGHITGALWFLDLTQGFSFIVAPLLYLYIRADLYGNLGKRWWLHMLPGAVYLLNSVLTIAPQPQQVLLLRYMQEWHPGTWAAPHPTGVFPYDPLALQEYPNHIMVVQFAVYIAVGFWQVRRAFASKNLHLLGPAEARLHWLRIVLVVQVVGLVVMIVSRAAFSNDLGDYINVLYFTALSYALSFVLLRDSAFLKHWEGKNDAGDAPVKYKTSSLTAARAEQILKRLSALNTELLDPDLSLPVLAELTGAAPHHLSQVLNERLGQSFFEYLAVRRVQAAQQMLKDAATRNLKIEELAERVGFNSRSAFATAFKKITGATPSDYRRAQEQP